MAKPGGGWIMCHAFADTLRRIINPTPAPELGERVIAAFTPHLNEQFGLTIAEYEVNVPKSSRKERH
jgi:outer membrane PBP1 activator LpoA protein